MHELYGMQIGLFCTYQDGNFSLEKVSEKYVDEDTTTALNIGKIIEIKDDYIVFKRFDGVGKWYPENKIYYSDISEILFGDRYTRIMSKYTHN